MVLSALFSKYNSKFHLPGMGSFKNGKGWLFGPIRNNGNKSDTVKNVQNCLSMLITQIMVCIIFSVEHECTKATVHLETQLS